MGLIHIDESSTSVNHCMAVISLGIFFEQLNHLHTPHTMHSSRNDAFNGRSKIEEMSVTVTVWRHQGYKFTIYLPSIIISHPFLILALGFFPLLSSASHRWRTREASSVNALPPQREVFCPVTPKLHHQHHPGLNYHRSPRR
jgi:hypothetical protein